MPQNRHSLIDVSICPALLDSLIGEITFRLLELRLKQLQWSDGIDKMNPVVNHDRPVNLCFIRNWPAGRNPHNSRFNLENGSVVQESLELGDTVLNLPGFFRFGIPLFPGFLRRFLQLIQFHQQLLTLFRILLKQGELALLHLDLLLGRRIFLQQLIQLSLPLRKGLNLLFRSFHLLLSCRLQPFQKLNHLLADIRLHQNQHQD